MLKEILIPTISVLLNWLALAVVLLDRREKRKNKRADGVEKSFCCRSNYMFDSENCRER